MELDSHSRTVCLAAELLLNSCFSDTVFVTLLPTALETAKYTSCFALAGGPHLLHVVVLGVAAVSWVYASERLGELIISTRRPFFSTSIISRLAYVVVKHHERRRAEPRCVDSSGAV